MSPERTDAYRSVLYTLAEVGPAKLLRSEQDRVRYAADSLIFCADIEHDDPTREALKDAELLCELLVESGRWERTSADRLVRSLRDCGPVLPAAFCC